MGSALPELPEELTAEWLSAALGWPIEAVERQILGKGQGFLGDIVRLHLRSDSRDTPASVIAKLPKKANRATGEMLGQARGASGTRARRSRLGLRRAPSRTAASDSACAAYSPEA